MRNLIVLFLVLMVFDNLFSQNKVGIGTITPNSTIHLYGTGTNGGGSRIAFGDDVAGTHYAFVGENNWSTNTDSDQLELRGNSGIYFTRGTAAAGTVSAYFDGGGILRLNTVNADNTAENFLVRQADGAVASRTISSILQVGFEDLANMRFGIRTTTPQFTLDVVHANGTPMAGSSDPDNGLNIRHEGANNENWTLYVSNADGDLEFYNQAVKEVEFTDDGAVNILSDERAKKNIADLALALPSLMQLSPKTYIYKHSQSGKTSYGFLAQDVEKIFPDFVDRNAGDDHGEESYMLNYFAFVPVLVKSIQEQQEIIDSQHDEILNLQMTTKQLAEKLAQIESLLIEKK